MVLLLRLTATLIDTTSVVAGCIISCTLSHPYVDILCGRGMGGRVRGICERLLMPLADWWTEGVASGWGGSRHMRGLWNEKADSFAKAGAVGGWSRHKITEGGLRAHWKHMQARASSNGVEQGKGLEMGLSGGY